MTNALEKLTPSFCTLLSHPRYKKADAEDIRALLVAHDKNGGLNITELKKLSRIYAKYQK